MLRLPRRNVAKAGHFPISLHFHPEKDAGFCLDACAGEVEGTGGGVAGIGWDAGVEGVGPVGHIQRVGDAVALVRTRVPGQGQRVGVACVMDFRDGKLDQRELQGVQDDKSGGAGGADGDHGFLAGDESGDPDLTHVAARRQCHGLVDRNRGDMAAAGDRQQHVGGAGFMRGVGHINPIKTSCGAVPLRTLLWRSERGRQRGWSFFCCDRFTQKPLLFADFLPFAIFNLFHFPRNEFDRLATSFLGHHFGLFSDRFSHEVVGDDGHVFPAQFFG